MGMMSMLLTLGQKAPGHLLLAHPMLEGRSLRHQPAGQCLAPRQAFAQPFPLPKCSS